MNPESLYVIDGEVRGIHCLEFIMSPDDKHDTSWSLFLPVAAFGSIARAYQESDYTPGNYICRNGIMLDHPAEDVWKVRISYMDWHITMYMVTWHELVRNYFYRDLAGAIKKDREELAEILGISPIVEVDSLSPAFLSEAEGKR
jgi:hypothetical protein